MNITLTLRNNSIQHKLKNWKTDKPQNRSLLSDNINEGTNAALSSNECFVVYLFLKLILEGKKMTKIRLST